MLVILIDSDNADVFWDVLTVNMVVSNAIWADIAHIMMAPTACELSDPPAPKVLVSPNNKLIASGGQDLGTRLAKSL